MPKRAKTGITVAKAKLYSTAWIIPEAWEVPEGFKAGECVAVKFLRVVWGCCVFQCTNTNGDVAAISELELERFVI